MPHTIENAGHNSEGLISGEQVKHWKEIVHRLPDVRLPKVLASRSALLEKYYEDDSILDETVRRLSDDIGVLCRRELRTPTFRRTE